MLKNYLSSIYNLNSFGIFNIEDAIVNADIDNDITVDVSFDGGESFQNVGDMNKKFKVLNSTGKIQVKITFEDVDDVNIYTVNSTGFFQNLEVGTIINFTKLTTGKNFVTNAGRNGYYRVSLPRGTYEVWYMNSNSKVTLMDNYNPEVTYTPASRVDKEAAIVDAFREIDWASYSVFDTFEDRNKMVGGNAIIDPEGDLSDGITNRKCRYWAIGFK